MTLNKKEQQLVTKNNADQENFCGTSSFIGQILLIETKNLIGYF